MNKKNTNKEKNMKLKLMGVSSTDTNIEVKFRITGELSSEEIFKFLQKHTAEEQDINLKAEDDIYTFIIFRITLSPEIAIPRIKNILDELIKEDYKRKWNFQDQDIKRSFSFWLADKLMNGEIEEE